VEQTKGDGLMPVDFFTSSKCATGAEISPVFHQRPANLFSAILNLATMGFVLVVYFPLLAAIRLRDYVAMSALLVARLAAGWLLGRPGSDNRKALALTTSLRNVGVGRDRQLRRHDGRHCCPGLWDLRDCWIVAAGPGLRPSESFSSVMSIHLVGIGIVRLWFSWFRSLAIRYG